MLRLGCLLMLTAGGFSATYTNPLPVLAANGVVQSCADPSIIRSADTHDPHWYAYCTTDPVHDDDADEAGRLKLHLIPILRSADLVNWKYIGDVYPQRPAWMEQGAALWAPAIRFFNGSYFLYYTVYHADKLTEIRAATSTTPVGPWTDRGQVVEPHEASCCPGLRQTVLDPEVIESGGTRYIFYGSYDGGIFSRPLTPDGLKSVSAQERQITTGRRYEGSNVVYKGGYWYLFVSATDCCRGALTGYTVFAGRSKDPQGPYLDREGISLLGSRVGGTVVISMNGNQWVGPGHNTVISDANGQDWFFYHAINRRDPVFRLRRDIVKRPLMLDRLDWIDGWPTVRGGLWASDERQPGPAVRRSRSLRPVRTEEGAHIPRKLLPAYSTDFRVGVLADRWSWTGEHDHPVARFHAGGLELATQAGDIHANRESASLLAQDAPEGDYVVETRVWFNVPESGCCFNYAQAGLMVYRSASDFVKLTHTAMFETRQTEFGIETTRALGVPGNGTYGNTVVGPPGEATFLRIVKRTAAGEEHYTPYTSRDGENWTRGGTWTRVPTGPGKIGLVAMGAAGFRAVFDYVRVYGLRP